MYTFWAVWDIVVAGGVVGVGSGSGEGMVCMLRLGGSASVGVAFHVDRCGPGFARGVQRAVVIPDFPDFAGAFECFLYAIDVVSSEGAMMDFRGGEACRRRRPGGHWRAGGTFAWFK
jgi:hypothetical protein